MTAITRTRPLVCVVASPRPFVRPFASTSRAARSVPSRCASIAAPAILLEYVP